MKRLFVAMIELVAGALFGQLALRYAIEYAVKIDPGLRKTVTTGAFMLGVILGVYLAGRMLDMEGTLTLTAFGGFLGSLLLFLFPGKGRPETYALVDMLAAGLLSIAILAPIMATLGFNLEIRKIRASYLE